MNRIKSLSPPQSAVSVPRAEPVGVGGSGVVFKHHATPVVFPQYFDFINASILASRELDVVHCVLDQNLIVPRNEPKCTALHYPTLPRSATLSAPVFGKTRVE